MVGLADTRRAASSRARPRELTLHATDSLMPDDAPIPHPPSSPRDGLAEQLRQLEDYVAQAGGEGRDIPPQAAEMIARLKEIMQALDGLTASLGEEQVPPPDNG